MMAAQANTWLWLIIRFSSHQLLYKVINSIVKIPKAQEITQKISLLGASPDGKMGVANTEVSPLANCDQTVMVYLLYWHPGNEKDWMVGFISIHVKLYSWQAVASARRYSIADGCRKLHHRKLSW